MKKLRHTHMDQIKQVLGDQYTGKGSAAFIVLSPEEGMECSLFYSGGTIPLISTVTGGFADLIASAATVRSGIDGIIDALRTAAYAKWDEKGKEIKS